MGNTVCFAGKCELSSLSQAKGQIWTWLQIPGGLGMPNLKKKMANTGQKDTIRHYNSDLFHLFQNDYREYHSQ